MWYVSRWVSKYLYEIEKFLYVLGFSQGSLGFPFYHLKFQCVLFFQSIGVHVCEHDQQEMSHSSKRSHVCTFCGKSFNRKQHLTDHTRMHTQERPYTCDLCKKSFSRKGYLKIHLRLHSGQRPFSCRICSKSFNEKSQLESHVYEHTREGPYLCNVCDKTFGDRISLILHQGMHATN